jgi:Na+/H+ antiporter NhaD/arsenite permease-like protein/predicted transcriptional regulator
MGNMVMSQTLWFTLMIILSLITGITAFVPHAALKRRATSSVQNKVWATTVGRFDKLTIKDIVSDMFADNPFVLANSTVFDAVEKMNDFNRGSVVIVDEENQFKGIFTERDFVTKVFESQLPAAETFITEVMTPKEECSTLAPDTPIGTCRELMLEQNRRRMPIVDSSTGEAIGVVSIRDIIRSLADDDKERLLYGPTYKEAIQEAKSRANRLALQESETGGLAQQDLFRTAFVLSGAVVGAGLIQGDWIAGHEQISMIAIFTLGYLGIIFETIFEFNKAAISLLMSVALWVTLAGASMTTGGDPNFVLGKLGENIGDVSSIVFFLMGAMTIVEIVDAHQGFKVVTDLIESKDKRALMWIIGLITFFMSAILDNLTTTIVMVSLIKKILPNDEDRKLFGAMIVIAANAGGAWTPIGDVTTTMLWIDGQISVGPTMTSLFIPSILSTITSIFFLQKQIPEGEQVEQDTSIMSTALAPRGKLVFGTGIAGLLSVPLFKAETGLPPYLGMLAALGIMWTLTDILHAGEGKEGREDLMAPAALRNIDTSGVLFFLGILLSVGALDSAGILGNLAQFLDQNIQSESIIASTIGVASAIIDNVPLVAATMGMYPISQVPMDSPLWQQIAFCAGTGGSLLVIGSAAGVALMGIEKVDFMWYAKRITASAFAGYIIGIGAYLLQAQVFS